MRFSFSAPISIHNWWAAVDTFARWLADCWAARQAMSTGCWPLIRVFLELCAALPLPKLMQHRQWLLLLWRKRKKKNCIKWKSSFSHHRVYPYTLLHVMWAETGVERSEAGNFEKKRCDDGTEMRCDENWSLGWRKKCNRYYMEN